MNLFVTTLLATIATIQASPLNASCTVTSYYEVAAALQSCTILILKDITVPARTTLELNLKPATILTFEGVFKWNYAKWEGPLIEIKGTAVTVDGAGATLDGEGAKYWDGKGDKGSVKPKFLSIKSTGASTFKNINLLNCPKQCVSLDTVSDTVLDHFNIDVSAGDRGGLAQDTDGFEVFSAANIVVQNSEVKNQDDCVVVHQGNNLVFHNLICSGGHGLSLSVGSTNGSPNTVQNTVFSDCTVTDSENGIHIETHSDAGTGEISNIVYNNIKLSGIRKYGINVQQDYERGHPTGKPKANIPISQFAISSVTGSMTGSRAITVYILCASGGCNNWAWSGVSIQNYNNNMNVCNFIPAGFFC